MKTIASSHVCLSTLCLTLVLAGCATAPSLPETLQGGLVRVKDAEADAVYVLPAAKFDGYNKVALIEPQIAFRKNWLSDTNSKRTFGLQRVSDQDMLKMIAEGKKMLVEEFTKELNKGGYTLVTEAGPDVLAVKVAIVSLDVYAPDPSGMSGAWTKTYTDGSGEATFTVELYDSVTGQLLASAADQKSNSGSSFSWRIPRDHFSNLNDARYAFEDWAGMLVKGLNRAKTAKKP